MRWSVKKTQPYRRRENITSYNIQNYQVLRLSINYHFMCYTIRATAYWYSYDIELQSYDSMIDIGLLVADYCRVYQL